jgi:cytochrome P450
MEAKVAVGILLDRFEVLSPVSDDVVWSDSYFARGPKNLPVRFQLR